MTENSEFVMDSSAWIAYFQGSEKGKRIQAIIEKQHLSTSTVAISEVVSTFIRDNLPYEAQIKFMSERSLLLLPGPGLCELAGTLKMLHRKQHPKFGMLDAIHLATAIQQKATLLTTDTDFTGIKNVRVI